MKRVLTMLILTVSIFGIGCEKKKDNITKSFAGTASVLMGASIGVGTLSANQTFSVPTDGNWNLSPNKAKINFTRIDFVGSPSLSATLTNCEVTYDRGIASGETQQLG